MDLTKLAATVATYILSNWIAILALATSLLIAYKTHWKPFKLSVSDTGRIDLARHPYFLNDSAFVLDIIFTNPGSRVGVGRDVALLITSPSGQSAIFRSFLEIKDRSMHWAQDLGTLQAEPFIAFNLKPGDTLVKRLMFTPFSPEHHSLVEGIYSITILARSSASHSWQRSTSVDVKVDLDDLSELAKTNSVKEADGRLKINWLTRSKVTESYEGALRAMASTEVK